MKLNMNVLTLPIAILWVSFRIDCRRSEHHMVRVWRRVLATPCFSLAWGSRHRILW